MYLANKKELLSLPTNTIFQEYEPNVFGVMLSKVENCSAIDDCYTIDLVDHDQDFLSCGKLELGFNNITRQGVEDEQLYAIWENKDLVKLIKILEKGIN